jgi:peptidyl-dipeptidase Dcp
MLIGLCALGCACAPQAVRPTGPGAANPVLQPWTGPYGGVPAFDRIQVDHFRPALEEAMAGLEAAIEKIAATPEAPTFDNTLAPMERAARDFDRVVGLYYVWSSTAATPEFQAVQRELEPKLAALEDRIYQNEKLFTRIDTVYQQRDSLGSTPEQKRLAWLYFDRFVRAGARLDAAAKQRVAAINERLAGLYTAFGQNVLAEENEGVVWIESEADLAGLPDSFRAAAAAAAEARGRQGAWAVLNTRSSAEPFLSFSERRTLREKVWRMFVGRGDQPGPRDNKPLIAEILALRAERAELLGYQTHAHWRIENAMAATPERALALLTAVWPAAVARVKEEVADMQAVADAEGKGLRIEPWDYRFYAERVRRAKYDLDANALKPYLQLDRLREGMFWVAGELFGLGFEPAEGVPVYHPDVRVWQVKDAEGALVGLWYFDPWARPNKRSGAWMSSYRAQEALDGPVMAIVSNNSNFIKGGPGEPVLISWDDATTLFHEFGHALHGLSSRTTYPSLSGTAVARDYVEFPSQILERWLETPELLNRFALHHATGEPMPAVLLEKVERSSKFNQGFATLEYLASALVDLKAHLEGKKPVDAAAFERDTLAALGMPSEIVMRHRMPHFLHVFASDGYSAGYYSYLWADTLSADAFEAFEEAKGPYDRELADRLQKHVFSAGNTLDPAEAYRAFRGRDAGIEALMRKRGFAPPRP